MTINPTTPDQGYAQTVARLIGQQVEYDLPGVTGELIGRVGEVIALNPITVMVSGAAGTITLPLRAEGDYWRIYNPTGGRA